MIRFYCYHRVNNFWIGAPLHSRVNLVHFKGCIWMVMKHTWWNWHAEPGTAYWNITCTWCKMGYFISYTGHNWAKYIWPIFLQIHKMFIIRSKHYQYLSFGETNSWDVNRNLIWHIVIWYSLVVHVLWRFLIWTSWNCWGQPWISEGNPTCWSVKLRNLSNKFLVDWNCTGIPQFWNLAYFQSWKYVHDVFMHLFAPLKDCEHLMVDFFWYSGAFLCQQTGLEQIIITYYCFAAIC